MIPANKCKGKLLFVKEWGKNAAATIFYVNFGVIIIIY